METEILIFDILQKIRRQLMIWRLDLDKTVSEILNTISVLEIRGVVEKISRKSIRSELNLNKLTS